MKMTKHAHVLDKLKTIMDKEAQAGGTGVPGADTSFKQMDKGTDTTDKNGVGADKNKPQGYKQEGGEKDPTAKVGSEAAAVTTPKEMTNGAASAPASGAPAGEHKPEEKKASTEKSASELGQEILALVSKMTEKAAQEGGTGVPGADTKPRQMDKATDTTDKNGVGADKNTPQGYKQEAGTKVNSNKVAAVSQEEIEKIASYEFGRQTAVQFLKEAAEKQVEMCKEAGRRDFEALIAQAAAEMEASQAQEKVGSDLFDQLFANEKQAEAAGAAYYQSLQKQAQVAAPVVDQAAMQKVAALEAKLAEVTAATTAQLAKFAADAAAAKAERDAVLAKQAEEQKRAQDIQMISDMVTHNVLSALKSEAAK